MKRILIVKLWALGDILMATPLLRALKRQWPDCEITWLADKDYAAILRDNPSLTETIPFDSGRWRRYWRYAQFGSYLKMSLALRRDLKGRRFDAVLNLSGEKWWSAWFNVAPVNVGLFPSAKMGRMARRYTHAIPRDDDPQRHNTVHYLRPATALGIPGPYDERLSLGVSSADNKAVRDFLNACPDSDLARPVIILHPGTSQRTKCMGKPVSSCHYWQPERTALSRGHHRRYFREQRASHGGNRPTDDHWPDGGIDCPGYCRCDR
jgi:ADP-heptose:LPS heptosyltransferase